MTLRSKINEAAFWHEHICINCDARFEQPETLDCAECGGELVSAENLKGLVERLEQECEDDETLG